MLSKNNIAFKEWAVVCAALTTGRQTVLLRKGGIDEGREGFRIKYDEFWLLPTRFHQDASNIVPEALPLWQQVQKSQPPTNKFQIDLYAVVENVFEIRELAVLKCLAREHILSPETIEQRFDYRHPGLFVLTVRIYQIPQPFEVSENDYIAGCKSWVELPEPLAIRGTTPILDDDEFDNRMQHIRDSLEGTL